MAKKTKKKAKKKAKKTTKKRQPKTKHPSEFTEQEKSILLHQKIHDVMKENPVIECTLKGHDDYEDRDFGICEAAAVFRMYNEAMSKHHLTFIPIGITPTLGNGCVLVKVTYQITDITTGWSEVIQCCGFGMNGQWSANTAQTLALKQALLNTFTCSWPQPEAFRDEIQKVASRSFGPAHSPEQISEAIKEFFATYQSKGKKK